MGFFFFLVFLLLNNVINLMRDKLRFLFFPLINLVLLRSMDFVVVMLGRC